MIYFIIDRHLFYFGESDFSFYRLLPMNIRPENRPYFENGFVLWDKDGMSLVGKGVKYRQIDSITIDKIVNYGFNENVLITKIIDTKGEVQLFEFTMNENPAYKPEISVRLINDNSEISAYNLKWFEIINNDNLKRTVIFRNWIMFLFIGLLITLTYIFFRRKNNYRQHHV
jgi:hypothetical protein